MNTFWGTKTGTRHVIHKCIEANVASLVYTSTTHVTVPRKDPLFLAAEHLVQVPPKDGFLFGHYGRTKFEAENLIREANGKKLANGESSRYYYYSSLQLITTQIGKKQQVLKVWRHFAFVPLFFMEN